MGVSMRMVNDLVTTYVWKDAMPLPIVFTGVAPALPGGLGTRTAVVKTCCRGGYPRGVCVVRVLHSVFWLPGLKTGFLSKAASTT